MVELNRGLGLFENWAATFAVLEHDINPNVTTDLMQCMNFVSGMPILFGFVMTTGGPQAAFTSWTMVSTISCVLALALAEIAAALPTAGGIYFWTYCLGGPEWGPFLSWMTAVRIPYPMWIALSDVLIVVELVRLDLRCSRYSARCNKLSNICSTDQLPRCCYSLRRLVLLARHSRWFDSRSDPKHCKSTLVTEIFSHCHCHLLCSALPLLDLVSHCCDWQISVRKLRFQNFPQRDQPRPKQTGLGCILLGDQFLVRRLGVRRLRCLRALGRGDARCQ